MAADGQFRQDSYRSGWKKLEPPCAKQYSSVIPPPGFRPGAGSPGPVGHRLKGGPVLGAGPAGGPFRGGTAPPPVFFASVIWDFTDSITGTGMEWMKIGKMKLIFRVAARFRAAGRMVRRMPQK